MAGIKLLYITTKNPLAQEDYLEVGMFHGLKTVLGDNFVDFPEKKIMYGDWSDTVKENMHGYGFSMYRHPFKKISSEFRSSIDFSSFDAVLFGTLTQHDNYPDYSYITNYYPKNRIWYLDGNDLYGTAKVMRRYENEYIIGNQGKNCFKRELIFEEDGVYPTGFGIPECQIMEIDLSKKNKLFQKTAPSYSKFEQAQEYGTRNHYVFKNEEDYYEDMRTSWFGLSCKKGGWDCLRHYEIMAAGAVLLFRDYNKKPKNCSPQNLPCFSYSSPEELLSLLNRLIINNKPSEEYLDMLYKQRYWLLNFGTTVARAKEIIKIIRENM